MDSLPGPIQAGARLLVSGTGAFLFVFSVLFLHHLVLKSPWFAVENIEVIGARRLPIKDAVALSGLRTGNNIFTTDIKTAARRVAAHPWVQEVRVRRSLPSNIEILVNEWEPAAVLSIGSRTMYVDAQGRVFNGLGRIHGLPHLTAIRGGEEFLDKGIEALKFTSDEPSEILMDGTEGVTLVHGDKSTIHLGKSGFELKNRRVMQILEYLKNRHIAYEAIDVDFSERAFVRILPEPAVIRGQMSLRHEGGDGGHHTFGTGESGGSLVRFWRTEGEANRSGGR